MERSLQIRTAESIEIRYELAGLGSRFLAVAIDVAIQIGVTVAAFVVFALTAGPLSAAGARFAVAKTGSAIVDAIGVFAVFALYFGYFIVFEVWWSGRTPGKRALGIRVVRDAGFPLDVGAAVIRNVVRVLEFGLGVYAVSAVSTLLSRKNKRLGDFAAGTIVIRDGAIAGDSIELYLARPTPDDDGLSGAERDLIERYVQRRSGLDERARLELAGEIARRVRPHLRAAFDHLDDDELLQHLGRGMVRG